MHEQRPNQNTESDTTICHRFHTAQVNQYASEQQTTHSTVNQAVKCLTKHATPSVSYVHEQLTDLPTVNSSAASLGQDLWQLKRVQIPVILGDKRTYQSWKSAVLQQLENTSK